MFVLWGIVTFNTKIYNSSILVTKYIKRGDNSVEVSAFFLTGINSLRKEFAPLGNISTFQRKNLLLQEQIFLLWADHN